MAEFDKKCTKIQLVKSNLRDGYWADRSDACLEMTKTVTIGQLVTFGALLKKTKSDILVKFEKQREECWIF